MNLKNVHRPPGRVLQAPLGHWTPHTADIVIKAMSVLQYILLNILLLVLLYKTVDRELFKIWTNQQMYVLNNLSL